MTAIGIRNCAWRLFSKISGSTPIVSDVSTREPHLARLADGLGHRDAGSSSFVDEVDEHERVVDHHTAEADDAEGLL